MSESMRQFRGFVFPSLAEANGIDKFAGPFVIFGIESVDVTDASAHEEKDDRLGFRRKPLCFSQTLLAVLCPHGSDRGSK